MFKNLKKQGVYSVLIAMQIKEQLTIIILQSTRNLLEFRKKPKSCNRAKRRSY